MVAPGEGVRPVGRAERERVRRQVVGGGGAAAAVDALVAAVHGRVPAYRALDGTQLPEVRAIAGWVLGRTLDLWVDGGGFSHADLLRFRGIGAARAADGRPLPAVLRAYRVAALAALDHVRRTAGDQLDTADVFALAQLWLTGLDELSEALYSGYTQADERLAGDRDRALRDFLDDLLTGRQSSAGAVADRSAHLGLRLPDHPCLLVAEPNPAPWGNGGPNAGPGRGTGPAEPATGSTTDSGLRPVHGSDQVSGSEPAPVRGARTGPGRAADPGGAPGSSPGSGTGPGSMSAPVAAPGSGDVRPGSARGMAPGGESGRVPAPAPAPATVSDPGAAPARGAGAGSGRAAGLGGAPGVSASASASPSPSPGPGPGPGAGAGDGPVSRRGAGGDVGVVAADLLARLAVPGVATPLMTTRGARAVLLLPPGAADAVPAALAVHGWRGCAVTGSPLAAASTAYRLAADALDSAPPHAFGPDALLRDADAHVLALLAARHTTTPEQVARNVLGPLLDPVRSQLAETLAAYLDTGSAAAAAVRLRVHPQTLRYRLRRIRGLTGRDPRDPWHRLTLDIARNLAGHA